MGRMNMPYEREKKMMEEGSFDSPKLYRPLPDKAGTKVHNEIVIPCFQPSTWNMFHPSEDVIRKMGMIPQQNGVVSIPEELVTFYFKIPSHGVNNLTRPDGSSGFSNVICPVGMNNYLLNVLQFSPMFERPRCALCEEENKYWQIMNERWEALGIGKEDRRRLGKDEYRRMVDGDPVLRNARSAARKYGANDRFIIGVFDHAKLFGQRNMDEGQQYVEHQVWFSPRTVFEGLGTLFDMGIEFYDTSVQEGINTVVVTKDTTECSQGDMMRTKYNVTNGKKYTYEESVFGYINDMSAMADPSSMVLMCDYDEMRFIVDQNQDSKPQHNQRPAPSGNRSPMVPPGGFRPPVVPPPVSQVAGEEPQEEGGQEVEENVEESAPAPVRFQEQQNTPRSPYPPQGQQGQAPMPARTPPSAPVPQGGGPRQAPIPHRAPEEGRPVPRQGGPIPRSPLPQGSPAPAGVPPKAGRMPPPGVPDRNPPAGAAPPFSGKKPW